MMEQSVPKRLTRPKKLDIFLHARKTLRLIESLLRDPRIPVVRKALFIVSIGGLLVLLLFPDIVGEVVMSTVLPIVGTVLGAPLDAGFDWVAFALAVVGLMRFFPAELVAEHYRSIFNKDM
jgi:hypothetical protein